MEQQCGGDAAALCCRCCCRCFRINFIPPFVRQAVLRTRNTWRKGGSDASGAVDHVRHTQSQTIFGPAGRHPPAPGPRPRSWRDSKTDFAKCLPRLWRARVLISSSSGGGWFLVERAFTCVYRRFLRGRGHKPKLLGRS